MEKMTTPAWREAPLFVLEGLDAVGRSAVTRLHREPDYRDLYDLAGAEKAECWRCWLGRAVCLDTLPVSAGETPWPDRDGVRDLLIVVGEGPIPARALQLANHVILVLPQPGQHEAEALEAFLVQWFDLLVRPGIIPVEWKDVRAMLHPGSPGYAATARVAGIDQVEEAARRVRERLEPFARQMHKRGGLLATISAGEDFGLDAFSAVGAELNPLVGEEDDFIVATILQQQGALRVWAMRVGASDG